ncbi:MAG: macro domain-containing protein [Chloroflexi bacterium]|nr:macro domain-containing protein [Chloroflexota bacterium]
MPLEVFHGSILDADADVIVCTANTELTPVAGLAKIVVEAAGAEVRHELRLTGIIPLGQAAVTSGGRLRQRAIIHVATRDALMLGTPTRMEDIERGTRNALKACVGMAAGSVAFPLLGAGDVGLPRKEVVATMGKVFGEYPFLRIVLCAFTPADREAAALLAQAQS